MRIVKTVSDLALALGEGQKMPPRWYGVGRVRWHIPEYEFYPIPLNYLVRFGVFIGCWWDRHRLQSSPWIHREIVAREMARVRRRAYDNGRADGEASVFSEAARDLARRRP